MDKCMFKDDVKAFFEERGFVFSIARIARAMRKVGCRRANRKIFILPDKLDDVWIELTEESATWPSNAKDDGARRRGPRPSIL